MGNQWLAGASQNCRGSLGLLAVMSDDWILDWIASLDIQTIGNLSQTCRALYVFCYCDSIWRNRTLAVFGGSFAFRRSWRTTFKDCCTHSKSNYDVPLYIPGFYSDLLFTSWRCSSVPLSDLCGLQTDNIDRRSGLSFDEFIRCYAEPAKPVILTDIVTQWPAFHKWSLDYFSQHCGSQSFRAEAVDMTFNDYRCYMEQCCEESPLYLFDKAFADAPSVLASDYSVPSFFAQDLFQHLETVSSKRPDYRWLIIGPARSGSTFHVDPNATSAWNAVIKGEKKWLLFPPDICPPGVFASRDGSEVTSPVSLCEWFLNYYNTDASVKSKPIECVCREGELIFIPSGYWHCVMNLSDSIAITQNFASTENLVQVLDFLQFRPEQVSGLSCEDADGLLYERFCASLDINDETRLILARAQEKRLYNQSTKNKPSLWTSISSNTDESFQFVF